MCGLDQSATNNSAPCAITACEAARVRNPLSQHATGRSQFNHDDCNYTVDTLGRLTQTSFGPSGPNETLTLDRQGNRRQHTLPNGNVVTYGNVDLANEMSTVDPDGPGAMPAAAVQYDAAGNLIVDEDGRTYVYDELNRLIELWSPTTPVASSHLLVRYTYDAFGRRIRADFDPDVPAIRRAINYYHDGHAVTEERDALATGEPRLRFHIHGSQYLDEHVATFEDTLVPTSPGDAWRFYFHNDLYTIAGSKLCFHGSLPADHLSR